ncbi:MULTISPECIES: restriction endonuclease [Gluconobacter]|uniref:Restriction endonuclease n=1 Tax=Gluconobacter cadivus TaxID=2728101 RepID=A0ABR9YQZ1_9PROT|nr:MULTISPECIES: restriction endonuclease [Gluconobacter]MBF0886937.1 restriction endonuclease [Gluconobacter cadivus]MBS1059006.1 restriction endonuclease [Gluconobacter sp. Dm-44]
MRGPNTKTLLMALALLSPATALADGVFHPAGQSYACVNPRATRALANHTDPRQNDPGWVHFVITDGRCFQVDPSEKWEQISQENGLLLLRRDPPRTGMPPLFFLPQQVSSGLPIPPQSSAEAPIDGPGQIAPVTPDTETSQPSGENTDVLPRGWEKPRHDAEPTTTEASGDNSSLLESAPSISSSNVSNSSPDTETKFGGLLIFTPLLIGAIGYFAFRERRRATRERRAWGIIDKEIRNQATALQIRRLQLVTTDAYGTIHLTKWAKEIGYFCNTRILSLLQIEGLTDQWPPLKARAEARIEEIAQRTPPGAVLNQKPLSDPRVFDPQMDPFDYERHCALLLEQAGWDARVTQASGDQGADIIATKGGRKIVVQCKLYSQPVGNKAVQEIYTAKQHQQADEAVVVSNAGYTIPARQLAATTGVHLLHHQELASFCERLAA